MPLSQERHAEHRAVRPCALTKPALQPRPCRAVAPRGQDGVEGGSQLSQPVSTALSTEACSAARPSAEPGAMGAVLGAALGLCSARPCWQHQGCALSFEVHRAGGMWLPTTTATSALPACTIKDFCSHKRFLKQCIGAQPAGFFCGAQRVARGSLGALLQLLIHSPKGSREEDAAVH